MMTFEDRIDNVRANIKWSGIDLSLVSVLTNYTGAVEEDPSDIKEVAFSKWLYQLYIQEAKKMKVDVSEYPTELNHLDRLLI